MKKDTMTATGRQSRIIKLNTEKENNLTEHADDMISIVSNCDGRSLANMLAQPNVSPPGHADGLHHGDVEEDEQEDRQQEEEYK